MMAQENRRTRIYAISIWLCSANSKESYPAHKVNQYDVDRMRLSLSGDPDASQYLVTFFFNPLGLVLRRC
jgi:hypothetical protein